MKIVRDFGVVPLLILTAFLNSGCGHAHKRADLVFLNGAEPETLDPALVTGQPEIRVVTALFEGLLAFNSTPEPRPGMAESWDISEDKRVYTFHIRHDARWSNGDPVTAHDFADSWQRALAPDTASAYSSQHFLIKNGQPFKEGKIKDFSLVGGRLIDDYTLQVTLEKPRRRSSHRELCAFSTPLPGVHGDREEIRRRVGQARNTL